MPLVSPRNLIRASISKMEKRLSAGSSGSPKSVPDLDKSERSLSTSSRSSFNEKTVVRELQEFCQDSEIQFSSETVYRFAAFHGFDLEKTKEAIQANKENPYLNLEMERSLRRQVATGVIFPISGLQTQKDKMDVIYIHAKRIDLEKSDESGTRVMDNLCYVLNDLSRTKEQCLQGVAVIINMKNYEESKFSFDYWMQIMMALQGNLVPTTVNKVWLVDPPKWFQRQYIWKNKTKPMLNDSFARKFRFIEGYDLLNGNYFVGDCKAYFPTVVGGWKLEEEIVDDYMDLKEFEHQQKVASQD